MDTSTTAVILATPYVEGDTSGQLTTELIRCLSLAGLYPTELNSAYFLLHVTLNEEENEEVGFRYASPYPQSKKGRYLTPAENRKTVSATVFLSEAANRNVFLGPMSIKECVEYDYIDVNRPEDLSFVSLSGQPEKTVEFSLGQLDSVEGAKDASSVHAYERLASKIVSCIEQNLRMRQHVKTSADEA